MKTAYIIPLLLLIPATSFAKWKVVGTPDVNGDGNGDPQSGNYVFEIEPKDGNLGNSGLLGASSAQGEWWVANDSQAPWADFVDGPNTDVQPSFHITEDLHAGDTFYAGLSFENQMKDYTSEFRMANDLFGQGAEIYFGLRNVTQPSILDLHTAASAVGENAPDAGALALAEGDPNFNASQIDGYDGLIYQGHSIGGANASHAPVTAEFDVNQFEWVHFETDNVDSDIIFTLKDNGGSQVLELTEWVAYFVLPDDMTTISGASWGDGAPPANVDGEQDVVFSWTVDGKEGYSLVQEVDGNGDPVFDNKGKPVYTDTPITNTTFNDPEAGTFNLVPEPSSVLFLFGGVGMLLSRRNRKVA